ncbi:diguanylate cyclase [Algibacillus agarilyticus]|uniref:diguanylate cyclase n=1 Tax=Algibacillus agarilyticus TaxID=2234133 RepID=UPI000DD0C2C3|nr:diguanylate cyclase [Algibacillus agarilyticus]
MLQIFLDLNCPYSYVLHERLLEHEQYDEIQWRYVEHLPAIELHGQQGPTQAQIQGDIGILQGMEPNVKIVDPGFCVNSRLAMLSLMMVEQMYPEKAKSYRAFLFRAYWQFSVDISRYDALQAILASLGINWLDYDLEAEHRQLIAQQVWQQGDYSQHLPVIIRGDKSVARGLLSLQDLYEFLAGHFSSNRVSDGCDFSGEYRLATIALPDLNPEFNNGTYGFSIQAFDDYDAFYASQSASHFDAILLNFSGCYDNRNHALNSIAEFKRHDLDFPIICVLDESHSALASLALNLGANETLLLHDDLTLQMTRIKKRINTHKAISILSKHAYVDGLTGLYNKRTFEQTYQREWRIASRSQLPLSLILLDFDFFKLYNDHYGHCAGDECLKTLSRVIQQNVFRPSDIAARFGGEEFILLLPDTTLEAALVVADRIRVAINEKKIEHEASPVSNYVSVSLGVASVKEPQAFNAIALVELADQALYKGKKAGRNQSFGLFLS